MKVTKKDLKEFKGDKRSRAYKDMKLAYESQIETKNVEDSGVGTAIENVLIATGIKKLVDVFTPEGEDCGCDERKKNLNSSPIFNSSAKPLRCMNEEQYKAYDVFYKTRKEDTWNPEEFALVFNTYEWVFALRYNTKRMCGNCNGTASILRQLTASLDLVYQSYK